jgi:hypothetical protein
MAARNKANLTDIVAQAQQLRQDHPGKYGTKGSRKGEAGYVANGWRLALQDAAQALGGNKKAKPKAPKADMTKLQKAALQLYLAELRLLQAKYYPLIGRKLSAKAQEESSESEKKKATSSAPSLEPVIEEASSQEPEALEERQPKGKERVSQEAQASAEPEAEEGEKGVEGKEEEESEPEARSLRSKKKRSVSRR